MAGHFYNGRELELLIPASSLEVLKIAVIFGADAVYIGGEAFGLRAKAKCGHFKCQYHDYRRCG